MAAILELSNLRKSFGPLVALDGISFSVHPGQLHGFVGPNGAGKTTTMRVVFGLVEPDAGELLWEGQPVGPAERLRFGYMPEERGLYPGMGVAEQLAYFAQLHGLDGTSPARAVGAWLERLGIAEVARQRLDRLSHGNQQRVQLAAALVHGPDLLVLDEPFAGLDPIGVDVLADVLREQAAAGSAVLFSSHQLELVEDLCETVTIIDRGRVRADGDVDALRAAAPGLLVVEVARAPRDGQWAERLPGVRVMAVDGDRVSLAMNEGDNDGGLDGVLGRVLDAARAAGSVRHFAVERPSLADLFRQIVAPDEVSAR